MDGILELIVQAMARPTGHPVSSSFSALEILGILALHTCPSCMPGSVSRLRNAQMKNVQLRILGNPVG